MPVPGAMPKCLRGHEFTELYAERLLSINIEKFDHAHAKPGRAPGGLLK
jgi:hypothetical protein